MSGRKGLLLALMLVASGCSATVEPTTTTVNVATIGVAGGTLVGQGSIAGAQISIPFGALPQETPVAIGPDPEPPADPLGFVPASGPVLLSPEGLEFLRPATILIPYTGLADVLLFTAPAVEGATWVPYDGGQPDITDNLYSASITHFSRWRVFRLGVDSPDGGDVDGGGNP